MLGSDKMSDPPHGPHEMGENFSPQLPVPAPADPVQEATALLASMVVGVNHPSPSPAMPGQSLEVRTSALEAATTMLENMGLGPDAALLVQQHVTTAVYASPVAQRAMQSDPRPQPAMQSDPRPQPAMQSDPRPQPAGPIRRPRAMNGVPFARHPYSRAVPRAVRRESIRIARTVQGLPQTSDDADSLQHQTVSALIGTIFGTPPAEE
mgnify:CR=1 FL=1